MNRKLATILITAATLVVIGVLYAAPQPKPQLQQDECCGGEHFGAIEGYVYDPNGQPVSEASVYAERTDAIMLAEMSAKTDSQGKFLLKELPPGTYRLTGSKEKDGYPPTESTFHYKDSVFPSLAVVYAQQISSNARVQLRDKVAKLVVHISDIDTGTPVRNAEITLRHADNPNYLYSRSISRVGDEDFVVLVPSLPVEFEISVPGYQKWKYRNKIPNQPIDALRLTQEETKELTIALRRNK